MKKRLLWIPALAVVAIALVFLANHRHSEGPEAAAGPAPPAPPPPTQFYPPASPPPLRKTSAPPAATDSGSRRPAPVVANAVKAPPSQSSAARGSRPSTRPARPASPPPAPPDTGPEEAAKATLENLGMRVREFSLRFGGNPVGTNAEITATLNGGNPKSVRFLSGELMRLNAAGELIDRWDTPYFFHQLSEEEMETRSAGPDRILWTEDDLVTR